jgi:protein AroM
MSAGAIGLITIGESPRLDIRPTYEAVLGFAVPIIEAGALDGLEMGDIAALAPVDTDIPLVTLAAGREVRIGKRAITPLLQSAIDRTIMQGAQVVVVLCTGHFTGLRAPVPLIEPDRVLHGFMRALQPDGALGVIMPDAGQMEMMRAKWLGYDLSLAVASPYQPRTAWDAIIAAFAHARVRAIVLDCMGFGPDAKAYFAERTGVPVLCAQTATAHLVRDLLWTPAAVTAFPPASS